MSSKGKWAMLIIVSVLLFNNRSHALDFELTWNAMPNAIGYKVCHVYSTIHNVTGCPVWAWNCEDVGNVLTHTITDIPILGNIVFRIVSYEETQYKALRGFSKLMRYESDSGNFSSDFGLQLNVQ